METAAAIAGPHDLVVQELPAILECDVGDWEGKSWVDIQQADPEAHRLFTTNPAEQGYRGGENLNQLLARVVPGLEQVMAENLGRTVATVAHNVVNRSYLAHVLGVPLSKARPITQNNCGVNVLRYRGGAVKMLSVNSIFHLEDWS
jgi:broad specificity phosphatase PhoE